jgi:(p)ppGpp synthase/HD superfamily hydrolase
MNLSVAIAIAANGFKNRTDKGGEPYILHCLRVMNNLHTRDKDLQCIAMLHDCVEDGVCTIDDLWDAGFSKRVITNVEILTHQKDVPYMDYIKIIAHYPDARLVKLADLRDNSDITRLKGLTKNDFDRMEKYHTAYIYLSKI